MNNSLPFIIGIILSILILCLCSSVKIEEPQMEIKQTIQVPQFPRIIEYDYPKEEFMIEKKLIHIDLHLEDYSLQHLSDLILDCEIKQEQSHEIANNARAMGWPEDCLTIQNAKAEWHNAELAKTAYKDRYNELSTEYKNISLNSEYPVATYIWLYLKDLRYNDYVCAGIMGNMMAETGGNTLDLNPGLYSSTGNYYGICQWSRTYYEVWNTDLEYQCEFLKNTIKYEIDTFGYAYQDGFDFNQFLSIQNAEEAAMAFAKSYERCATWTYPYRTENANVAYDYFINYFDEN